MSRVAEGWRLSAGTAEVLRAATVASAEVLERFGIGRLAPGAKADILSVDLADPCIRPGRHPLRNLVFYGTDAALRDVWVDGRQVVADGAGTTIGRAAALDALMSGVEALLEKTPARDDAGRGEETAFPRSLSVRPHP
jgi:cytosine/adenosine deaminase-related metal-dependent hydrolase